MNALPDLEAAADAPVEEVEAARSAALGGARARRLKDMVYVKEMRAAITSGEFALRLRGADLPGVVDYQRLCSRLDAFAARLGGQPLDPEVLSQAEAGKVLDLLVQTRTRLEERLVVQAADGGPDGHQAPRPASATTALSSGVDLPDPRQLLLYMREDKIIDFHFDEALTEANKAAKFSRDLWERLNGRPSHERAAPPPGGAAPVPAPEPAKVQLRRRDLAEAKRLLEEALQRRAECRERASGALGQSDVMRAERRACEELVRQRRCREAMANIDWLLERAFATLEADLERASVADWDATGKQLKLLVVEFSLLEKQQLVPEQSGSAGLDYSSSLYFEELHKLREDVREFVTRLGLEVEREDTRHVGAVLQRWLAQCRQTLDKMRTGVAFYVNGARLLWQDVQYAASLFVKAAFSNYTLQPREVRTMQRTAKDLATFIPFLIILIIPLTPVGHVLVFSFIQKFFPDFFPSTFTERRQNVAKIYRDIVPDPDPGA